MHRFRVVHILVVQHEVSPIDQQTSSLYSSWCSELNGMLGWFRITLEHQNPYHHLKVGVYWRFWSLLGRVLVLTKIAKIIIFADCNWGFGCVGDEFDTNYKIKLNQHYQSWSSCWEIIIIELLEAPRIKITL